MLQPATWLPAPEDGTDYPRLKVFVYFALDQGYRNKACRHNPRLGENLVHLYPADQSLDPYHQRCHGHRAVRD